MTSVSKVVCNEHFQPVTSPESDESPKVRKLYTVDKPVTGD